MNKVKNILTIDTSTEELILTLTQGGKDFFRRVSGKQRMHSEILLCELDALLSEAGAELSDIDVFGANVGPGSFTGIRIGVTAARCFCQTFGRDALAFTGFDALAYNINEPCFAVVDASGGKVYVAEFSSDGSIVGDMRTAELSVLSEAIPSGALVATAMELSGDFRRVRPDVAKNTLEFAKRQSKRVGDFNVLRPLYVSTAFTDF